MLFSDWLFSCQVEVVSSNIRPKHGMVRSSSVPSTAAQPGTPSSTIIFEEYDPHSPAKRGRPKGSKNKPREHSTVPLAPSTNTFRVGRFPLLPQAPIVAPTTGNPRPTLKLMIPGSGGQVVKSPFVIGSQGFALTPGVTLKPSTAPHTAPTLNLSPSKDGTGPGTPGSPNTPTAQLKKILKGQILKRSCSVSGDLNSTKDGPSGKMSLFSSPKYLRSESVDEAAIRQHSVSYRFCLCSSIYV